MAERTERLTVTHFALLKINIEHLLPCRAVNKSGCGDDTVEIENYRIKTVIRHVCKIEKDRPDRQYKVSA